MQSDRITIEDPRDNIDPKDIFNAKKVWEEVLKIAQQGIRPELIENLLLATISQKAHLISIYPDRLTMEDYIIMLGQIVEMIEVDQTQNILARGYYDTNYPIPPAGSNSEYILDVKSTILPKLKALLSEAIRTYLDPMRMLNNLIKEIQARPINRDRALHKMITSVQQMNAYTEIYPGIITPKYITHMIQGMIEQLEKFTDEEATIIITDCIERMSLQSELQEFTINLKTTLLPALREMLR